MHAVYATVSKIPDLSIHSASVSDVCPEPAFISLVTPSPSATRAKLHKMGKKCCVPKCTSGYATSSERRTQFTFPRDEELRNKWIAAIRRKDFVLSSNTTICEKHFEDKFKRRTSTGQLKLDFSLKPIPI